ncbi:MAG: GerW family sporulation protein [Oscillospiraceae bacterium]|jgi:sporulation protein YtfJ|nr:GerW family sporulation protein [Oscillospiraceae bacterium]
MSEHPIESIMSVTMQKIREMVDVNTIVGEPILTSAGTTIIPLSKVTYGFASGGSDFPNKSESKDLFGGGSGAGITIIPVAILTVNGSDVKLLQVEPFHSSVDKAIEMIPDFIDKIKSLFKKSEKDSEAKQEKVNS